MNITFRGTAQGFRANLAELLEYDKQYKWLVCGMCQEKTPAERYVIGARACISCANKEEAEYEAHKDTFEKYPNSFISAKEQETKEFMTMHQGDNMEPSGYNAPSCDHNHSCEHWV